MLDFGEQEKLVRRLVWAMLLCAFGVGVIFAWALGYIL